MRTSLLAGRQFLDVLAAGTHGIVTFQIGNDGTLTHVNTRPGVPAAAAGIAVR